MAKYNKVGGNITINGEEHKLFTTAKGNDVVAIDEALRNTFDKVEELNDKLVCTYGVIDDLEFEAEENAYELARVSQEKTEIMRTMAHNFNVVSKTYIASVIILAGLQIATLFF